MTRANFAVPLHRVLILDTGPLWELVLYSAVHSLGFKRLEQELLYVHEELSYRRLTAFIAQFPRKVTTPHVVAEISRKTRDTQRNGQTQIWAIVYREFGLMRMEEELIKLLDMPHEMIARLGATDVGVIKFGLSILDEGPLVLSVDRKLVSECQRARLEARLLSDVISSEKP